MELLLDKEPVFLTEVVYDGQTEQGVEFDYVLPDYYPDIFKILKCTLTPGIVSYSVSGSQLFLDGVVYIKVLYLSEQSGEINCVEQRYTYSKTIELVKPANRAVVTLFPKADYCNCRAVSGRRIDVRGAISCTVKVTDCREDEILCGVSGMGTQVKRGSINYCGSRLSASRQYIVREDIETGAGGGIVSILTVSCTANVTDTKIIADKVVVKGEAKVKSLYLIRTGSGVSETEVMEAEIPLSQIVDLDGITEGHSCFARFDVMDCDLEIKQGEDGENRLIGCDLTLDCKVTAYKEAALSPVCDLYSTEYESSYSVSPIRLEHTPQLLSTQHSLKSMLECSDGTVSEVFDCRCELLGSAVRESEGNVKRLIVSGQANIQLIGRNDAGTPVFIEKNESFEFETETEVLHDGYSAGVTVSVTNVSYSISGDSAVDVHVQLLAQGLVYQVRNISAVSEISINEEAPKQKNSDYALKLYFAESGEKIWDIAKRYNTSVSAVLAENELEQERLAEPCMLLIPMV